MSFLSNVSMRRVLPLRYPPHGSPSAPKLTLHPLQRMLLYIRHEMEWFPIP